MTKLTNLTKLTINTEPLANALMEVVKQATTLFEKLSESNRQCQAVIQEAHDTLVSNNIQSDKLTQVFNHVQDNFDQLINYGESITDNAETMIEDMSDLADDGYIDNYDFTILDNDGNEEVVQVNEEVKAE